MRSWKAVSQSAQSSTHLPYCTVLHSTVVPLLPCPVPSPPPSYNTVPQTSLSPSHISHSLTHWSLSRSLALSLSLTLPTSPHSNSTLPTLRLHATLSSLTHHSLTLPPSLPPSLSSSPLSSPPQRQNNTIQYNTKQYNQPTNQLNTYQQLVNCPPRIRIRIRLSLSHCSLTTTLPYTSNPASLSIRTAQVDNTTLFLCLCVSPQPQLRHGS